MTAALPNDVRWCAFLPIAVLLAAALGCIAARSRFVAELRRGFRAHPVLATAALACLLALSNVSFRGFATRSGTLSENPPESPLSLSFIQSGGVELVEAQWGGKCSPREQIMNQADTFYYSGHGMHASACLVGGGVACYPSTIGSYWTRDLECVIFACCSVLDINDYRKNFRGNDPSSPGALWAHLGPRFFLGYNGSAPADTSGAPVRVAAYWNSRTDTEGKIMAWMRANANNKAWNACAIDAMAGKYYFFRRNRFRSFRIVERKDW